MRRKTVMVLVVFALVAAACGDDADASGVASIDGESTGEAGIEETASIDTEEAVLSYVQCLRDEGLEVDDPEFDDDGGFQLDLRQIFGGGPGDGGGPDEDVRAAMDVCQELIDGALTQRFEQVDQSELQDNLLAFAECMREEGYDMADPDLSGAGGFQGGPGRGLFGDLDLDDPGVQAAVEVCQAEFGDLGPGGGPGGRPGGAGGEG